MIESFGKKAAVLFTVLIAATTFTTSAHAFDCSDCHGTRSTRDYRPIDSSFRNITTGGFQGNHRTHMGPTTDPAVCEKCHPGSAAYTTAHPDEAVKLSSNINDSPLQARYKNATSAFSQTARPVLGTCSSVNCHFESSSPTWGSASYNSQQNCSSCHQSPGTSSSHARHDKFYPFDSNGCIKCHPDYKTGLLFSHATSAGKRGILVRLAQGSYTGSGRNFLPSQIGQKTFGECRNVYCHSDGKGNFATPAWGNAASGSCGSCHGNPAVSFGHPAHLTAPYGPKFGTDPTGIANCAKCHAFTGATSATHINRTLDTPSASCSGCHPYEAAWTEGRVTCESCHSGGVLSSINGVAAHDKRLAPTVGHGKSLSSAGSAMAVSCSACHDGDLQHIQSSSHSSRLAAPLVGSGNADCLSCHNDPAKVPTAKFRNISTHFLRKLGPQEMVCRQCHDPHGTGNLSMIRSRVAFGNNSSAITFRNISTGLVEFESNRGLCQVCHTQTRYYRTGVPETKHLKKNCISCHPHNARNGAFSPVDGNCDTCHGYPPIPSTTPFGPPDAKRLGFQPDFRGYGTFNNWTNARYENYSGGGGAHLEHVFPGARASEGWFNCSLCHDNGRSHKKIVPRDGDWRSRTYGVMGELTVKIDPRVNFFNAPFVTYTGGKLVNRPQENIAGRCMGTCHGGLSPTWSWPGYYDTTPPSQTTGLTATATSTIAITLSWSAATDTGGSSLWGYLVERAPDVNGSPGTYTEIAKTYYATCSVTELTKNTKYWFRVRAFDGRGNTGTYSSEVFKVTLTDDPLGAFFNMGTSKISVSWSSGGSQSGYRVYRDADKTSGVLVYNGTASSFDDPITGSHIYYVYSTNSEGILSAGFSKTLPTTPSITGAASSTTSVRWTINTNGKSAYGYKVHAADHTVLIDGLVTPGLDWFTESLWMTPNTLYTRHVHSSNAAGESAPSANVNVYTLSPPPNVTSSVAQPSWDVMFTNAAGFGPGAVQYYRYVWDNNPTYSAWTGTETQWPSGILTKNAATGGSWYLHVRSYNADDVVSGSADYGPYNVPLAPALSVMSVSATSVTWGITANSTSADGFRLHDTDHTLDVSVSKTQGSYAEGVGFSNLQYTRHLHAYNAAGMSLPSSSLNAYTLSPPASLSVERTQGTYDLTFTNGAAFGAGGVEYYRYVWDHVSTYTGWNGTEPRWENGTLPQTGDPTSDWYLHVRPYNAADAPNGSRDFGPYNMDGAAPAGLVHSSPANGVVGQLIGTPLSAAGAVDDKGGAVEYFFQVATDSAFTQNVQNSGWLAASRYQPVLANNTTYYWRVKARGAAALVSTPFTEPWSFTTTEVNRIFYSVGQNTNDHKTGTPTVTVSGTTATFSVAQTAVNMGVGDVITYGGQNKCYISAKVSPTAWSCVTATGGVPVAASNAQVNSVKHAFSSLNAAIGINGENPGGAFDAGHLGTLDLVLGHYQLNIPCYYDSGADMSGGLALGGFPITTSSASTIKIYTPYDTSTEVNQSQRHDGKWKTNAYRLQSNDNYGIMYTIPYVEISGLQVVYGQSAGISAYFHGAGTSTRIHDNIITFRAPSWMPTMSGGSGIEVHTDLSSETPSAYIYNNIVYDITAGVGITTGIKGSIYNNTIYNSSYGMYEYFGRSDSIMNNISQQCTVGMYSRVQSTTIYDYNISNDATAVGAHSKPSTTVSFVDAANKDFHLSPADVAARNSGADLSADPWFSFNTDIDRQVRPAGSWDIGADEGAP